MTILKSNIKAEGKNGIQGGGGGAGGSILINYEYIDSDSNVSVAGGNG